MKKTQRGITLIALIITIVILSILAVVTVNAIHGDGIIAYATNSADAYNTAAGTEKSLLETYVDKLNQYGGGDGNGSGAVVQTPTDQKYLLFTHNESTLTSTFMGMNPDYKMENGYYGEGDYVITDLVIPAVVKNDSGKESIVTRTDSIDKENGQNTTIKTIVLPETIESIGQRYTFCNWTALETINIPEKVTTIPPYTFSGCTSLTDITIPESVTSIAPAFSGCTSLTTITIPKNVTSLSGPTFSGCTSLTTVTIEEGFNGSFQGPTFSGCTSLTTVNIPSSVTSMTTGPFSACSSNTKIYVDKYEVDCSWGTSWYGNAKVIYKIGRETPQKYLSLSHVANAAVTTFNGMNSKYKMENGYYGEEHYIITDLVIPKKVKNFAGNDSWVTYTSGSEANEEVSTIKTVELPETIELIGSNSFYNWTGLTSINIPSKVKTIGAFAFKNCTSLTSITIPKNVTSLGGPTFSGCTSLTTVTIEEGFNGSFQGPTFSGCTSLKTVHIPSSVTSVGGAFLECSSDTKIYVDKYESECSSWGTSWYGNATVIYKTNYLKFFKTTPVNILEYTRTIDTWRIQ